MDNEQAKSHMWTLVKQIGVQGTAKKTQTMGAGSKERNLSFNQKKLNFEQIVSGATWTYSI